MKSLRKILDFADELNKLDIPIIVHQGMKCSRCHQRIGRISNEYGSAYPCLNVNCGNFSDYHTIKATWEKLEAVQEDLV